MREFGVAYDRFREEDHAIFDRFLDLAVAELAEDGKIAPVRLALFSQMLKDKPWSPATLKDMRGLEGIGVKFLEESLDGETPTRSIGSMCWRPGTCCGRSCLTGRPTSKGT